MPKPYYDIGTYRGIITDQALGKASTGTAQFILKFRIIGPLGADGEPIELAATQQYERTMYRAITERTIDYVMEDLEKLGFQGASFKQLDLNAPNACDFRGHEIDFYCGRDKDQQGNDREKWSLAFGARAINAEPLDAQKSRELDTLFGKALKQRFGAARTNSNGAAKPAAQRPATQAAAQARGARAPEPEPPEPPEYLQGDPSDDDVPF